MAFRKTPEPKTYGDTEIVITSITGAIQHNDDHTWISVQQGAELNFELQTAPGEPRLFALTLLGMGNTPEAKFFTEIDAEGKAVVDLKFTCMGDYKFTNLEANRNLPEPLYFTKDVLIEVGRASSELLDNIESEEVSV